MKVLILTIVALSAVYLAEAQDTSKWEPLECVDGHFTLNVKIQKTFAICNDPKKYGEGEGKKNPNCSFYCTAKQIGLLNRRSQTSRAIYDKWATAMFPEQYKDMAKAHFADCFTKFGDKIPTDGADCKAAAEFMACTWTVVPKMPC